MTDLERAAHAAYLAMQADGDKRWDWDDPAYVNVRTAYIVAIGAALKELREPSAMMSSAGHEVAEGFAPAGHFGDPTWKAMIDQVLSDRSR